ncbi:hypothetical protein LUZ61_018388 [Rhynchospora tenuis]|uniref:Wall-associated receptor kinase galacturonan-binding domain-containing protein n=1 Tax=Rhynchospora tenuis TaxID=198213 RepID=A0AAD6ELW9_9POAL|nr:hypothetical protein LUZ61_018388 [Rhynchospora tenuis]
MAYLLFFNLALLNPLLLLLLASSTSSVAQLVHLGCQSQCGDVKVDYPFGIGKGCGRSEHFQLLCKRNDRGRVKPFIRRNNLGYDLEVSSISVSEGLARIKSPVSSLCYNRTNGYVTYDFAGADLTQTPFWVSNTQNMFIVIGSNVYAYISLNGTKSRYTAGCEPQKLSGGSVVSSSCSGIGCCEVTLPIRSKSYFMLIDLSSSNSSSSSTCGYAVLTEADRFRFSTSYLTTPRSFEKDVVNLSVFLDWTISSEKCELAQRNITSYACVSSHSTCIDYHGLGYRCSCVHGYRGNPYIRYGCQRIKDAQRSVPVPLN